MMERIKQVRILTAKSSYAAGSSKNVPNSVTECHTPHNTPRATHRTTPNELLRSIPFALDVDWTRSLFKWFAGDFDRTHRYAAYVFGSGGEGKTRIVRALLQGKNVFECRLTEPYAFDGYDSSTEILLVEDVHWSCFDITLRSTLLSIMARQPAVIQRKYKPQTTIVNDKVLTVFTSNFKLPVDTAFRRRSYVIWAKVKACKDDLETNEDDPGDDDALYISPPKLPSSAARIFPVRKVMQP